MSPRAALPVMAKRLDRTNPTMCGARKIRAAVRENFVPTIGNRPIMNVRKIGAVPNTKVSEATRERAFRSTDDY